MFETGNGLSIPVHELAIRASSPRIENQELRISPEHGVSAYIKIRFPCSKDHHNDNPYIDVMYIRLSLTSQTFIFTLYCPQDVVIFTIDKTPEMSDDSPPVLIHICSDF